MSIKITDIANNLTKAILESDEYEKFQKARDALQQEPDLMQSVQDFRKQQFEIQVNQYNGTEIDSYNLMNLQNTYSFLMTIPLVAAYLDAEYEVSKILSEIHETIGNAVDLNLDFMNH